MTDDNLIVLAAIREARRVDAELEACVTRHPSTRLAVAGTSPPVAAGGRARRRPLTDEADDGGEAS